MKSSTPHYAFSLVLGFILAICVITIVGLIINS